MVTLYSSTSSWKSHVEHANKHEASLNDVGPTLKLNLVNALFSLRWATGRRCHSHEKHHRFSTMQKTPERQIHAEASDHCLDQGPSRGLTAAHCEANGVHVGAALSQRWVDVLCCSMDHKSGLRHQPQWLRPREWSNPGSVRSWPVVGSMMGQRHSVDPSLNQPRTNISGCLCRSLFGRAWPVI